MRPYVLGVIPARGGSKGVPRKNIRLLAGKPLIAYTIDAALKAKMLDRVIVSTDDEEIARISRKYRAEVPFIRPKNLSGDSTPMLSVLRHAMEYLGRKEGRYADVLVSLQPTSPFRNAYSIDEAVEKLVQKGFDTIVNLCKVDHHPFWMKRVKCDRVYPFLKQTSNCVTRQSLPPLYRVNGSIYVTTRNMLMKEGKKRASYATQLQSEEVGAIILDGEQCLDIDTIVDFALAETIIKKLVRNKKK